MYTPGAMLNTIKEGRGEEEEEDEYELVEDEEFSAAATVWATATAAVKFAHGCVMLPHKMVTFEFEKFAPTST